MDKEITVTVEPTSQGFDYWLNRPYVDADLKALLSTANLIIAPREDYPGHKGPIFPQGTDQLFTFLKENSPKNVSTEVCISDSDYTDLLLYHDLIDLGIIVVQSFIAPVTVALVVNYVNKLRAKEPIVKMTLTVVEADNTAKQIIYEGPIEDLEITLNHAIKSSEAKPSEARKDAVLAETPGRKMLSQNELKPDQETLTRSSK